VSYIGLGHVFTANITGNVVLLGFGFAGTPGLSVPRSLASLAAFFLGAIIQLSLRLRCIASSTGLRPISGAAVNTFAACLYARVYQFVRNPVHHVYASGS
jgi:uncharacterized membrane protein YoaK (UPF0700 family)